MRVTVCGPPGSGKGTITKMIADKFGLETKSMGDMRRAYAASKGWTIHRLNKEGEKDPSTDEMVDKFQTEYGKTNNNFIIEGRLSWYFIEDSIKLYIDVKPEEAARRIFEAKRDSEGCFSSVEETLQANLARIFSDRKRYKKYYGVDCYDTTQFDHVIDSTGKTSEQVFEEIKTILFGYQKKDGLSS